jgi:hypothetical protein
VRHVIERLLEVTVTERADRLDSTIELQVIGVKVKFSAGLTYSINVIDK